jgi:hypothetical protein
MKRREFMAVIGGAMAAWPRLVQAQQPSRQHRLALVHSGIPAAQLTESARPFWVRRFHETLGQLGDVEGRNLVIERFSAEGRANGMVTKGLN